MSDLILAIDQGTTSTRCILFDGSGPVASASAEHRQICPRPGWVEHDAQEIATNVERLIDEVIQRATISPGDILAIGITNQRETVVAWEKTSGKPICNAIVWQDTRTQPLCDQLAREGFGDRIRQKTGLPLATYFSATKIRWILDNIPHARALADAGQVCFGTIDSWLAWRLAGEHVTDVTNASRTLLMNLESLSWDHQLLELFKIPGVALPRILPSISKSGHGEVILRGRAIPIRGILGDQQAALVGQGCITPGRCKNTYGTGCFMLLHTGERIVRSKHGLLTTVAYQFDGETPCYALEGSVAVAGALVQWLRDRMGLIASSQQIEALAAAAHDNGGVYFVPAFSGLFAPRWRPDARGTIVGLTAHSGREHIARAALESTAYQTRDVLDAMRADSDPDLRELRVDGGMTANSLLMQFQSDILGIPLVLPRTPETTALGAAFAAGKASGLWHDPADLAATQPEKRWEPRMSESEREALYACWLRAVEKSLDWA